MSSVSYSLINQRGGVGNQFFYYAFAKSYANRYGALLHTPESWVFRKLFKGPASDPVITEAFPQTSEDEIPNGYVWIDLNGAFQRSEHLSFYSRSQCLDYFELVDEYKALFPPPKSRYVAAHVRRGDYVDNLYWACTISRRSYAKVLEEANPEGLEVRWVYDPVITDWKEERYSHPLYSQNHWCASWLPDFMTLVQSEVLIRANSTFSYWAGVFHSGRVYSPRVNGILGEDRDVNFEPNNKCRITSAYYEWEDFNLKES